MESPIDKPMFKNYRLEKKYNLHPVLVTPFNCSGSAHHMFLRRIRGNPQHVFSRLVLSFCRRKNGRCVACVRACVRGCVRTACVCECACVRTACMGACVCLHSETICHIHRLVGMRFSILALALSSCHVCFSLPNPWHGFLIRPSLRSPRMIALVYLKELTSTRCSPCPV